MGRAGSHQLPRLRRVGAAAERAGHRRAADPQPARGLRPEAMGFGSAEHVHLFVEAKKLAFEDRARYYADPEFAKIPVKTLISKDYAAKRRKLIDLDEGRARVSGRTQGARRGRHHLHDRRRRRRHDGLADPVQLPRHGLGHDAAGCGFILQDRGELFALEPRPRQRLRAGQAPVPHHHPRVRHEGRQALALVRRDGRRACSRRATCRS